jgi:hypothetical protein
MNFPFLEFKDLHSSLLSSVSKTDVKLKIKKLVKELECISESRNLEIEDHIKKSGIVLLPREQKVNSEFITTTLGLCSKLNINGHKAAQILNFSIENSTLGLDLEENSIIYYKSFKKFQLEILKEILRQEMFTDVIDFSKIQKEILLIVNEKEKKKEKKEILEILILIQKSGVTRDMQLLEILKDLKDCHDEVAIGILISCFYAIKRGQNVQNLLDQEWKNDLLKQTVVLFTMKFRNLDEKIKKDWFLRSEKSRVFHFLRSLVDPKGCGMDGFGFTGMFQLERSESY